MEPLIGIDLGTTYSAVATVQDGVPIIIPSRAGQRLTPSIIGITSTGERVVGDKAQVLGDESPDRVAPATKRFIGKRWSQELANEAKLVVPYPLIAGPSGEVRISVAGKVMPLTQVSAMLLGELKLDAEAYFKRSVKKCVITVPANFDDGQRQATREAATIAGLEVLRIVNEPTAAAIAYGTVNQFQGRALVFDLGGGTFDVSILNMTNKLFEVSATGGDPQLGGDDYDARITQWLVAQVPDEFRDIVTKDRISMQRLRSGAERAKRALSQQNEASISITELGDHTVTRPRFCQVETALSREFLEVLAEPLSTRCLEVCQKVLDAARLKYTEIEAVMLVGGMTRMPLIRKLVTQFFGKTPVGGVNPDEAVALGAAVHAHEIIQRGASAKLVDVATHSLSVGVLGGKVRRLISKNTPVPATAKEVFHPGRSRQRAARIPVFEGEGETAQENNRLGELVLADLNVVHRVDVPIEVTFELSGEGILSVKAVDTTSGASESIRIEARTTLSASEVEALKEQEAEYARSQGEKTQVMVGAGFFRLIDRVERLVVLLEKSAAEMPSPAADEAIRRVRALIAQGKEAAKKGDTQKIVEISPILENLVAGES